MSSLTLRLSFSLQYHKLPQGQCMDVGLNDAFMTPAEAKCDFIVFSEKKTTCVIWNIDLITFALSLLHYLHFCKSDQGVVNLHGLCGTEPTVVPLINGYLCWWAGSCTFLYLIGWIPDVDLRFLNIAHIVSYKCHKHTPTPSHTHNSIHIHKIYQIRGASFSAPSSFLLLHICFALSFTTFSLVPASRVIRQREKPQLVCGVIKHLFLVHLTLGLISYKVN